MLFFAQHTSKCVAKKLFKLLYLLDVESFRLAGRTVTGLEYSAYTPGPVPHELAHQLEYVSEDIARYVRTVPIAAEGGKQRQEVLPAPGAEFDDSMFTPRQLSTMYSLAARYSDAELEAVDVSDHDCGAYRAAFARGREEEIHWEDTLMPTDPLRGEKLAAAERHRRSTRTQRSI